MNVKKNRNLEEKQSCQTSVGTTHETQEKDEEEYHFLKEFIKKKPVDKKKIFIHFVGFLGGAVIFGMTAAFVFQHTLPYVEPPKEKSKIEFPQVTPTPMPTATPSPVPASEEEISDMNLEELSRIYKETEELAEKPEKSLVTVKGITNSVDWMDNECENYKQVSGFIAADTEEEYVIVTEYRAVDTVDRILVTFVDGTTVDANFQKQDPGTGLSILKVRKEEVNQKTQEEIQVAELGCSTYISRGMPVLALGSPEGYKDSVAYGMITSVNNKKSTTDREYHLLTTDIMGTAEGSGVLVDLSGKIIGIIAQSFSDETERNSVVAVPISELSSILDKLSNKEEITYLGVQGQNISIDLSGKTGIPKGIYVHSVQEDSPAMVAGIQNGDVIIKFEKNSIETLTDLGKSLDQCKSGQKITLTGMRKGAEGYVEIVFDVILGAL